MGGKDSEKLHFKDTYMQLWCLHSWSCLAVEERTDRLKEEKLQSSEMLLKGKLRQKETWLAFRSLQQYAAEMKIVHLKDKFFQSVNRNAFKEQEDIARVVLQCLSSYASLRKAVRVK